MFNSEDQPQPVDAGFDHWMATQNNAAPSHKNPANFVRNGVELGEMQGYSCQIVVEEGLNWLKNHVAETPAQPFFLYLAFHEPHEPVASPEDLTDSYMDVAENRKQATYFANVANVDLAVGKFLQALADMSLDEHTLVVFTADNGPETLNRYPGSSYSYGSADPLRGMKLWTTDAGFRVAGIMQWPAKIKPGQTVHQPVSALDFLPTFCELAGIVAPGDLTLDGTDFSPLFEGREFRRKKPLIWAYYNSLNEHQVAMRDGDWKVLAKLNLDNKIQNLNNTNINLVRSAEFIDFEVYEITEDIHEDNNLSDSGASKVNQFKKKLKKYYLELLRDSYIWTVSQ